MNTLKRFHKNNKGASMMVAVIIIAILMIFVFSLLLITYTLYASQSKKTASFRNAEAANTVSQAFKTELEDSQAEENSAFWKYLRCNIGQSETWPWYEPGTVGHEKEDAFRKFDLDYVHSYAALSGNGGELDGFPAKVQMTVYWMLPEGKDSSMVSPDIESFELTGIRLHMEIVCETAGQSYMVKNVFELDKGNYGDTTEETRKKNIVAGLSGVTSDYNPQGLALTDYSRWKWTLVSRE